MLLGHARDPLDVKDILAFHDFGKNTSDDFLSKVLETIFQIWGDQPPNLGYMPYLLIQHFLLKGRDSGLLKKFLLSAPYKWLNEYWPPLNDTFNVTHEFLNDSASGDAANQAVRKIIVSLIRGG